jgi:GTP cyclohydrolase I
MSITLQEFILAMNEIAPENLAESWDNSGIQINTSEKPIEKILVCLDITTAVIHEAVQNGIDLIISHHPILFQPINKIDNNNLTGKYLNELIRNDISVYSAHTSYDSCWGGNNDQLAIKLELDNIKPWNAESVTGKNGGGLGRIGFVKPALSLREISKLVKSALHIPRPIPVAGNPDRLIHCIAVCAGAGADAIDEAREKGCDLLITGDVKYRHGLKAIETDMAIMDAGHYFTEIIFIENLSAQLRKKFGDSVQIVESEVDLDPFVML